MHRKLVTFVVYIQKNDIFVVTNLQFLNFQENNFEIWKSISTSWLSITHRYISWSQFVIFIVNVLGNIHKLISIKRIFALKVTLFS